MTPRLAPVPGDVVPVPAPGDSAAEKVGLDVLLSGVEFDRLRTLVDSASFDEFEAFRAHEDGVVYLTLVFRAPAAQTVVCLPVYYQVATADRMLSRVRAGDALTTYVHPLSGDERVEFDHEDPTLLFPPAAGGAGGAGGVDGTDGVGGTDETDETDDTNNTNETDETDDTNNTNETDDTNSTNETDETDDT